jgi:glutamate-1-semialdehyde aminotransferase
MERAKAHIWDVDGNQYIDYRMYLGRLSWVDEQVNSRSRRVDRGTWGNDYELEIEVMENPGCAARDGAIIVR